MNINIFVLVASAFIPLVIGLVWYNAKVFGRGWLQASGLTEEKLKGANMPLVFGLSFLFSFFLSFAMYYMVVHSAHVFSLLANEPGIKDSGTEINTYLTDFMARFASNFRTFKHGVLHGTISGITVALPIVGTNALFERKGFKYIAINAGYWTVSFALMGGVICQFA